MANVFSIPGKILSGGGALELSGAYMKKFGKRALIVTDEMMEKLGNLKRLTDVLEQNGVTYGVYTGINGEPTDAMIQKGLEVYSSEGCDFLIGLGGGSPMDSMKAIAAVAQGGGEITDYMGKIIEFQLPSMVAIPTTAGTGSEATQFTIITDTKNDVKMLLKGPSLMPDLAVIDPVFTATAPPAVTAATGLDALCHAVEAYTSLKAFPLSDTFAVSAIKRIFANLKEAYDNGSNLEARAEMALAALEAGVSFSNASVTIIHGMSRPIGALYHVPHGLSNAMLLPECLKFAVSGAVEQFDKLAEETGLRKEGMSVSGGAMAFIEAVNQLCESLQVQTLAEFGVDKDDFFKNIPKMATDAIASGSPANTRRQPTKDNIEDIYKALWT